MPDIEQRSADWFAIRCGKVTASRIADVMAKLKSGQPAATRTNYQAQLVTERLTGTVADSFTNAAMQWGIDTEDQARAMYAFHTGHETAEIGFVVHPTIADSGASPDGLVGEDGLVEIKCPNSATHIDTLKGGDIPDKYVKQMQWQMACTGRAWCDFASFDPRLPVEMQLHVERVERDDILIAEIEAEVIAFLADVEADVAELTAKYLTKEAA